MVQSNKPDSEFDNDSYTPFAYASCVVLDNSSNHNNNTGDHAVTPPLQEWACPQCTLLNPITADFCDACMMEQPTVPGTVVAQDPSYYVETEDGISHASSAITYDDETAILIEERPLLTRSNTTTTTTTNASIEFQKDMTITPMPVVLDEYHEGEDPVDKKIRRRRRRRARMMAAGTGGLIVGVVIACGPVLPLVGAAAGAASARIASKRRERAKDERVARRLAIRNEEQAAAWKKSIPVMV